MATWQLGLGDCGKLISVRKGDNLSISLPENPTTGYRWSVELSDSILKLMEPPAYLPVGDAVGSGGARVFTLIARDIGDSELAFRLRRPWVIATASNPDIELHINIGP